MQPIMLCETATPPPRSALRAMFLVVALLALGVMLIRRAHPRSPMRLRVHSPGPDGVFGTADDVERAAPR